MIKKNNLSWKKISRKILFKHPKIFLVEDEIMLPDGSRTTYLLDCLGHDSVTVICIKDNQVLLQQEYSYPPNELLYQFPGGKIEKNESPIDAGTRELIEESKLEAQNICEIGWYYINNRRSNAKMFVVVAEDFENNDSLKGDPEENIKSQWIPISQFEEMIKNGQIVNFSVLAAWTLYKNKS